MVLRKGLEETLAIEGSAIQAIVLESNQTPSHTNFDSHPRQGHHIRKC